MRGRWLYHEPMARHVSWRAGGAAARAYVPADIDDLAQMLASLPATLPVLFVGLGSNLLVREGGFPGVVVFLHGALSKFTVEGTRLYAEAGVAAPKVARQAARHGLAGAEFLAGIPGTVGGALAMNAGAYGSETWEIVRKVLTVDRQGAIRWADPAEFDIAYRSVTVKAGDERWFLAAWFELTPGDGERLRQRIRELLARRVASQPLNLPNAGSVFRNPRGDHAARLIESCGLKGYRIGGAQVSEKHANFIVNLGGATATDIEALIEHVQATVENRTGVRLIPEVRIVGERR